MKLNTTREERARQITDSAPVFLSHQLAADVEALIAALVAEKRAHAESALGYSAARRALLVIEADELEKL